MEDPLDPRSRTNDPPAPTPASAPVAPRARGPRRRRFRALVAIITSIVALASLVLSFALHEVTAVPARLLAPPSHTADVVVVPSGDPGGRRTAAAAAVVSAGLAPRLLITGTGVGEDSSRNLAALAARLGVPPERITTEERATTTFENMQFSAPLIASLGAQKALVVTSRAHARRAALVAERAWPGVDVKVMPVEAGDTRLRPLAVEAAKTLRYAWLGRLSWRVAITGE